MMGYWETPYDVEQRVDMPEPHGKGVQHVEIRVPIGAPSGMAYIALEGHNAKGRLVHDRIFKYGQRDLLDADWARLTGETVVQVEDLNYSEMIMNHHVGYTKDGGVTMY